MEFPATKVVDEMVAWINAHACDAFDHSKFNRKFSRADCRLFRMLIGKSVIAYRHSLRMNLAKDRLRQGESIQKIVKDMHWYDMAAFSNAFFKFWKKRPSECTNGR